MVAQTSINVNKVLESCIVCEISDILLFDKDIKWGECRKKKLLSKTWVISSDAKTFLFEMFLIFEITANKGLTILSAKYFAACQIFLVFLKKSS